jgi:putative drug exporter of the RND superfamily
MFQTALDHPTTPDPTHDSSPGLLGRLGVWVTRHSRLVTLSWLVVVIGLGVFAPKVEHNLSGAGWQADGSESVAVREPPGLRPGQPHAPLP